MNDTKYGLTSGVYTKDKEKALSIMKQINSGTVYWNCCDRVAVGLPWSGMFSYPLVLFFPSSSLTPYVAQAATSPVWA